VIEAGLSIFLGLSFDRSVSFRDCSLIVDCCMEIVSRAFFNLSAIGIESKEDSATINSRLVILDLRLFLMGCILMTETTINLFQAFE
jgi:hypothetical protein